MHLKKIIKTKIVCLLFLVSVSSYSAWQGAGTQADPWQITSRQCLEALADSVNNSTVPSPNNWSTGKHFMLMNDIIDTVRTVIGISTSGGISFQGHFDGQNFEIVLGINSINNKVGLFGAAWGADISNLITKGYVVGAGIVGGVVGEANCIIINVTNNCFVTGTTRVGGIVGYGGAIISNSTNNGKIFATVSQAGGIFGSIGAGGTEITNCVNNGNVISITNAGGISGIGLGTVENCINTAEISADSLVGGISGHSAAYNTILNNINYGFVKGNSSVGGISGRISSSFSSSIISNNSNFGVVVGEENTGCIVGFKGTGNIIIENNHYDKQMCGEED